MANDSGTVAVVTGASSGIGEAIAEVLAERGHDLGVTARRRERLEALATRPESAHDIAVHVIERDLGEHGGADALYGDVAALGKRVDVLVNNAGFGVYGSSIEADHGRIASMVELNLVALTRLTHRFGRDMLDAGGGRILQVASITAFQPSPLYAVYAASKAYVLSMSTAINQELSGSGVSMTTICPGLTDSEFHQAADHLKPRWMDWTQMSSRQVAEVGVRAMMKRRSVVTPGLVNKLAGWGVKWIPRSWATAITGWIMQGKRSA